MADPLELCSLRMNIPGQRKLCGGVPRQGLERLWIRTVVVDVGQEGTGTPEYTDKAQLGVCLCCTSSIWAY